MTDYLKDLAQRIIESGKQDAHIKAKIFHDKIENFQKEKYGQVFTFDDVSNIKLTDLQKAKWRKTFADIRVKNGIKPIVFTITHKQPNLRRANHD